MKLPLPVLFVDDQVQLYETAITDLTRSADFTLSCSPLAVEAINRAKDVGVLVLDLEYPGQESDVSRKLGLSSVLTGPEVGIAVLEYYHKHYPDVGVIIVTQNPSDEAIGRCFQLGAFQYLDKDRKGGLDCIQLSQEIRNAVELVQERKARRVFDISGDAGDEFVSRDQQIRDILKEAAKLSRQKLSILLLGESGVGKERLAKFIHRFSDRAEKPFVAVNVGTLQRDLLGSELFGYVKGAFTGANSDREGLFEAADTGTIFLDEIGEASADVQVGLLRVLQEAEIRRVGANKNVKIDVRVLAATNRNLQELIKTGDFREDLYFRLATSTIVVPPLRKRPDDILVLANHFVTRFCRASNQPIKELSADALEALCKYEWPGNVRELQGVIERTVALTPKLTIGKDDLSLPANKSLGEWGLLIDELAMALSRRDPTARRFMSDLNLLVYDRLYQTLGTHSKVAKLWGKEDEAMTAQRQRWADSLAKEIFAGERRLEDVPSFLREVCAKYLGKMNQAKPERS